MRLLWFAMPLLLTACRSTSDWREQADQRAQSLLQAGQQSVTGKTEPIRVETPAETLRRRLLLDQNLQYLAPASLGIRELPDTKRWQGSKHLLPEQGAPGTEWNSKEPLQFSIIQALQVAATNSREFQAQKDRLFSAALTLDLEADDFRNTFSGMLQESMGTSGNGDYRLTGSNSSGVAGITRKFKNGLEFSSAISVNLVKMLTGDRASFWGVLGDASISVPLLRGAGEFIVQEPLRQAERNLLYAVREFEQYKKDFAYNIVQSYLNTLQAAQKVRNQAENYKRVVASTRRSRRMANAGRLPEYQFDQAVQDELRARDSWIAACQSNANSLDSFKILVGLPTDAQILLQEQELTNLAQDLQGLTTGKPPVDYSGEIPPADAEVILSEPDDSNAGKYEIQEARAIAIAFRERLDLQTLSDRVADAQRKVLIAEDALRAELTLGGSAAVGQRRSYSNTSQNNAEFNPRAGAYSGLLTLDLPWERTRERNAYRESLLNLEAAVRSLQSKEDNIKLDIRRNLRMLRQYRETLIIQSQAVTLAERRVKSTDTLLQAGRAEIRDLLEAQGALLSAQNSLTSAVVNYRLQEFELQRNLGVLSVSSEGQLQELNLQDYKLPEPVK